MKPIEKHESATHPLLWIETALDAIAYFCRVLTGVALVVLTVIFGWLVFRRYVLNATPTWVAQVALLVVIFALSLSVILLR